MDENLRSEPGQQSRASEHDPKSAEDFERVLVVGAGTGGRIIAQDLTNNPRWKMIPIGFVDDDPTKRGLNIDTIKVIGDTASIPSIVRSERVDLIVIAIPSAPPKVHQRLAEISQTTSARVLTMPALGSILRGEARVSTLTTVRPVDVLGRPVIIPDRESCLQFIKGRRVLITGAAGSIGSELVVQIADLMPAALILVDTDESGLHDLSVDISLSSPLLEVIPYVCSITDEHRLERIFETTGPEIVLHAAAYKHVGAMERQPDVALDVNVGGTMNVARLSRRVGVERFVLISTDKAVRPTSVMGASKRLAELAVSLFGSDDAMSVCSVRFGNVLGSRGSVIPTFERQIRNGGPITVTDERMRRYFMTIPEAVSLVIQAGAFGHRNVTYILDMGDEVAIMELARRVIELHGLRVGADIQIRIIGAQPGEKLHEELTLNFESAHPTAHPKIRMIKADQSTISMNDFTRELETLRVLTTDGNIDALGDKIRQLVHRLDANSEGHIESEGAAERDSARVASVDSGSSG